MGKLSKTAISKAMKEQGAGTRRVFDGDGLFLELTATSVAKGQGAWRLKFYFDGAEKRMSLGRYPDLSPEDARRKAREARDLLDSGIDPARAKKAARAAARVAQDDTLSIVVGRWIDHMVLEGWTAATHSYMAKALRAHVLDEWGDLPVREFTRALASQLVNKLRDRPTTAHRVWNALVRALALFEHEHDDFTSPLAGRKPAFSAGKATHRAGFTPTTFGSLEGAVEALRDFLKAIRHYKGTRTVATALRALVVLPVRSGELVSMRWDDLELKPNGSAVWRFIQTKTGDHQTLTIPAAVVAELRELGSSGWVFKAPRNSTKHIGGTTLLVALGRMDIEGVHIHGLRSTFRSLAREKLGIDGEVLERCLGHRTKAAHGRAYDQTGLQDEKDAAIAQWAEWLRSVGW